MALPTDIKPPFTQEKAMAKVRAAEDAWNSRDEERVSKAYSIDSVWRNRDEFIVGREQIQTFLSNKWEVEGEYRLAKELWSFSDSKIAVRFQYEYQDVSGDWFRAYGNELWEFNEQGLMKRREASINDVSIIESERTFYWPIDLPRPSDHTGI